MKVKINMALIQFTGIAWFSKKTLSLLTSAEYESAGGCETGEAAHWERVQDVQPAGGDGPVHDAAPPTVRGARHDHRKLCSLFYDQLSSSRYIINRSLITTAGEYHQCSGCFSDMQRLRHVFTNIRLLFGVSS